MVSKIRPGGMSMARRARYLIDVFEVHPAYRLEIYSTAPYLVYRYMPTGHFTKLPDELWLKHIKGVEYIGGHQPIEVEIWAIWPISTEELKELAREEGPEAVRHAIEQEVKDMNEEMVREVIAEFGALADYLEDRGWELMHEAEEERVKRWRHRKAKGWGAWREEEW